jgi:hypothetical protein
VEDATKARRRQIDSRLMPRSLLNPILLKTLRDQHVAVEQEEAVWIGSAPTPPICEHHAWQRHHDVHRHRRAPVARAPQTPRARFGDFFYI